jgi:protein arginine kinase
MNARAKLLEADAGKLFDKIGRAYGILQNSHLLSSGEAMNLLSLIRLGIDLGAFPDGNRSVVDRLLIEAQPGHLQHARKEPLEAGQRDVVRAGACCGRSLRISAQSGFLFRAGRLKHPTTLPTCHRSR